MRFYKFLFEEKEESLDDVNTKPEEEEDEIPNKVEDISKEDKEKLKDELKILIINNNIISTKDNEEKKTREKHYVQYKIKNFKDILKSLSAKKLLDYKGDLSSYGRAYLKDIKMNNSELKDIDKFIQYGPKDWMIKLLAIEEK